MNFSRILLAITAISLLALPAKGWTMEVRQNDTNARIEKLEKQLEELKAENAAKSETAKPEKTSIGSKFPVDLYGFVAAQIFWGSARTQLYGYRNTGENYSFVAQSATADKALIPVDDAWIGFTPQNSRIGLNWTGSKVSKALTLGGKLELDFLNPTGGASPRPRIRLFYLDLGGKNWLLRAGQDWDVFSPLNTKSLSLGGNLWYQGDLGFRRPQVRFVYTVPFQDINSVAFTIAANNPSNLDTIINGGNASSVPYGDASVQYKRKMNSGDLSVTASGIYGKRRDNNVWSNVWGIAGSLCVPFHKFLELSGEFQYGENLGDFLTYAGTSRRIRSIEGWGQISSRWHEMFETNVGYGISKLPISKVTDSVADLASMIDGIHKNQIIFANFRFIPVKPFYFGVEYNQIRTAYRGQGTSTSNIVFSNIVYNF